METNYERLVNGKLYPVDSNVVQKHGTHTQEDHGNWARGVSAKVVEEIQRYTREWGGLSISMVDGHMPDKGYMVAKPPEFGKVVDEADFFDPVKGPKILSQYMREQKADLATGKNYLGTWLNEGKIYLDVSQNIMDRDEATRLGAERNQLEIWDVVNQVSIKTGGTGRVEKGNQDGGTEESRRYDRRRNRRLRDGDLDKVRGERKETQVIRFAFGLKPVFKHEGGGHDQSSHGNWATGEGGVDSGIRARLKAEGYSDEEIERIAKWEGKGPTTADLDRIMEGAPVADDAKLADFVSNDGEQYDAMTEYSNLDGNFQDRVADFEAKEGREATEQERVNFFDEEQQAAIAMYVRDNRNMLNDLRNEQYGGGQSAESYVDSFGEVFNSRVTVTEEDGNEYDIYTKTQNAYTNSEGITVEGEVYADGMTIGRFERLFFKEGDTWNVEHKWFDLEDEYQGKGFGKEFIRNSFDYYTAQGMGYVKVMSGLEDGARHWARMGFDWNPQQVDWNMRQMRNAYGQSESTMSEEGKKEFESIFSRGYDSNTGRTKDPLADDFPFPAEFASIGWDRRTRDSNGEWDWDGKRLMAYKNFEYAMPLTAEGRNLLSGPIDRDGDGLVYDGTARERPAKKN